MSTATVNRGELKRCLERMRAPEHLVARAMGLIAPFILCGGRGMFAIGAKHALSELELARSIVLATGEREAPVAIVEADRVFVRAPWQTTNGVKAALGDCRCLETPLMRANAERIRERLADLRLERELDDALWKNLGECLANSIIGALEGCPWHRFGEDFARTFETMLVQGVRAALHLVLLSAVAGDEEEMNRLAPLVRQMSSTLIVKIVSGEERFYLALAR